MVYRRVPPDRIATARRSLDRTGWDPYRSLALGPADGTIIAEVSMPRSFPDRVARVLAACADQMFHGARRVEVQTLIALAAHGGDIVTTKLNTGYGAPRELSPIDVCRVAEVVKAARPRRIAPHLRPDDPEVFPDQYARWRDLIIAACHRRQTVIVTPV